MGVNRSTAPAASDYAPDATDDTDGSTPEPEDTPQRSSTVTRRGWGAAKQNFKKTASSFEQEFKVAEKEDLVKFLEDEPFVTVLVHWVDEIREGKRSFYCPESPDEALYDCPLCGVGHPPKAEAWFNVVPLTAEGAATKPAVAVLKTGPMLSGILEKENEDRSGPLSRHFWAVKKSKTGSGNKGRVNYHVRPIKARDLADDWEMDPQQIEDTLAALKPYESNIVRYPTKDDLDDIVQTYLIN